MEMTMQRGPFTFQWRPCVIAGWQPRPMDRERNMPQVVTVTGIPEGTTSLQVMHQMERTSWGPRTTALTAVAWADLGLGKLIA